MRSVRHLHLEGHLVATADVADTYRYDADQWSSLFVFRTDEGFTLVALGRSETYGVSGAVERGIADITVDYPADVGQLEELVSEQFRVGSDAWWQILDSGRHHDDELYAAWVPERMRHDLYRARLHDRDLALTTGFFNGETLPAQGRAVDGWKRAALETMVDHLEELGWRVQEDRPFVAETAEAGGILSEKTEILGALRARRYGWEALILVRVDDCGEIYARLANRETSPTPSPG